MKNCVNCRYSRDVGPYLACYGQKGAPEVDYDYVCEDWKSQYTTNADRIRAMTDEELAEFISGKARTFGEEYEGYMSALDWLKQEVKE